MSRVISKQYADALNDHPDLPPMDLMSEEETPDFTSLIASNEATLRGIVGLTSVIAMLIKRLSVPQEKEDNTEVLAVLERIVTGQWAILAQLKIPKKPYRLKIVRDKFGEFDYIDVI